MMRRALLLVIVGAVTLHAQAPDADTLKFRDGAGPLLSVTLEDVNDTMAMTWPETGPGWDTALLGVSVTVGFEGAAPFIEMAINWPLAAIVPGK